MATSVIVPDYGTSVDHVVLRAWLKDEGDPVRRGDLLCELETDKASTELEAFAEGVLLCRLVEEGSEVEIGAVIAYIGEPGEQVPEALGVANDRDARDLGHVLERQHHVGHQGQAPDLEEDLVLSAHRLRGTAVAGGHHRGDAHRTPTVGRARPGHKTLDRPSREFGARQSQTSGIWRPPEPTSGI